MATNTTTYTYERQEDGSYVRTESQVLILKSNGPTVTIEVEPEVIEDYKGQKAERDSIASHEACGGHYPDMPYGLRNAFSPSDVDDRIEDLLNYENPDKDHDEGLLWCLKFKHQEIDSFGLRAWQDDETCYLSDSHDWAQEAKEQCVESGVDEDYSAWYYIDFEQWGNDIRSEQYAAVGTPDERVLWRRDVY